MLIENENDAIFPLYRMSSEWPCTWKQQGKNLFNLQEIVEVEVSEVKLHKHPWKIK